MREYLGFDDAVFDGATSLVPDRTLCAVRHCESSSSTINSSNTSGNPSDDDLAWKPRHRWRDKVELQVIVYLHEKGAIDRATCQTFLMESQRRFSQYPT